ncbi:tail fiber domain-containing protein [bacterium]|nr:tail fiber domain-containing protein [bacterium]
MKNLAFTLAEMMVILAIFSVISAATLPVITARQNIDNSDSVTNASAANPWVENAVYLALGYYDSKSALGNTSAVIVGGQVSERAYSIGYPQLIVRDNYGINSGNTGSQIVLLKPAANGNTYYGGRIALGPGGIMGYGSVAFGPDTMNGLPSKRFGSGMQWIGANVYAYGNVALGSKTLENHALSNTKSLYNTAIGKSVLDTGSNDNVGIGTKIFYNQLLSLLEDGFSSSDRNVVIGYGINTYFRDIVAIGSYAGDSVRSSLRNVIIGTYAGTNNRGDGRVNIGFYSGYQLNSNSQPHYSITIGTYAGAYSTNTAAASLHNMIAIGTAAGKDTKFSGSDGIYIGPYAGTNSHSNMRDRHAYQTIMIGTYAGYRVKSDSSSYRHFHTSAPIIIGPYAAYTSSDMTQTNIEVQAPVIIGHNAYREQPFDGISDFPDVAIGYYAAAYTKGARLKNSIFIGTYAGYGTNDSNNSVCIGEWSCAYGASGEYNTIISPYGYFSNSGLKGRTSVIGYPSAITNNSSALGTTLYNQLTSTSGDYNKYSNMVLAPDRYNSVTAATSKIFFYTNTIYKYNSINFDTFSDRRLKTNITPSLYGLNEIRKINIYEFNYKGDTSKTPRIGVIAQEMQKIIPEAVSKMDKNGYLAVSTDWIIFPMINAIKELDKSVLTVDSGMKKYLNEYVSLANRVSNLEKEVKELEKENKSLTKEVNIAYKKAKMAESRQ